MARRIHRQRIIEGIAHDADIYAFLASRERDGNARSAFTALAAIASEQRAYFAQRGAQLPESGLSVLSRLYFRALRIALGSALMARFMLGVKDDHVRRYRAYCAACTSAEERAAVDGFADRMHAVALDTSDRRVAFFSNIVLGFNDSLIELTGALVGFSFALRDASLVAVVGMVTGISASMSMTASAYQQARHENGRDPILAALYTGATYFCVALVLVAPFVILKDIYAALVVMGLIVAVLVAGISVYSSILLSRRYPRQLAEMGMFSVGVAIIAFFVGFVLNLFVGVDV